MILGMQERTSTVFILLVAPGSLLYKILGSLKKEHLPSLLC